MSAADTGTVPRDVAERLCGEIRAELRGRWWSPAAWRCAWCNDLSRGDPSLRRFALMGREPGCRRVNARWEAAGRPPR